MDGVLDVGRSLCTFNTGKNVNFQFWHEVTQVKEVVKFQGSEHLGSQLYIFFGADNFYVPDFRYLN